ncbi:Os02g0662900 [Oryza sativa Japonica Group]|uniref:Os02g0662900 protein n=1 Tax=Oryza sativa subsp. japonica TaxID=39947 RepID=A0A0P0VMK1_ORYSJ|nr:hypothetical protein EE612_012847 [Oryza sativa]BAS80155.1 Os02g0662900 [Oryza sativa Japonica Group]
MLREWKVCTITSMINSHDNLRTKLFHQPKNRWQRWCTSRAANREANSNNFITRGRNEFRRIECIKTDGIEFERNSELCGKLREVILGKVQLQWMVRSSRHESRELQQRQGHTSSSPAVGKLLQEGSPLTTNTEIKVNDMDAGSCHATNLIKKRLCCGKVSELEHR